MCRYFLVLILLFLPSMAFASSSVDVFFENSGSTIEVGDTRRAYARYDGEEDAIDNSLITWSSSNNYIATVNSQGVVSGVSPGNATITASIDSSFQGNRNITVDEPGGGNPGVVNGSGGTLNTRSIRENLGQSGSALDPALRSGIFAGLLTFVSLIRTAGILVAVISLLFGALSILNGSDSAVAALKQKALYILFGLLLIMQAERISSVLLSLFQRF